LARLVLQMLVARLRFLLLMQGPRRLLAPQEAASQHLIPLIPLMPLMP
jgi:hypothetical protein